ncbi:MAG: hypothetical protein KAG20_07795 [Cocleimonas sp.]|nr:hypothetical protein [Cocleimonas sp.]
MTKSNNEKRGRGRPRIADELKVKNNTSTIRVPLEAIDTLKALISSYKDGLVGLDDIQGLIDKKL